MLFVYQDGLSHDDIRVGKGNFKVSLLRDGHPSHDDIKLVGNKSGNDAVPGGIHRHEFNTHLLGQTPGVIHVESDKVPLFIGHLKRNISRFKSHAKLTPLQDFLDGGLLGKFDVCSKCWRRNKQTKDRQGNHYRKKAFPHNVPPF